MKKILIFVLMLFSISGITIFGADINYNFNITDNFKWNLETGAIESDLKFAITSKMIIGNSNIETIAETYHHVVFWNNKNQYIGYKNTQYSILENAYYLGDIERGNLGFDAPANAHFFSFMIYKSGNRIPDANLNNQSLFQIFGTYSTNNLHQKDNNELDGYDLDDLYNTQLTENKNLSVDSYYKGTMYNRVGYVFTNYQIGETYTATGTYYKDQNIVNNVVLVALDSSNNELDVGFDLSTTAQSGNFQVTLTIPTGTTTLLLGLGTSTSTRTGTFNNIQLEKGSTATDYELPSQFLTRDYFKDYEQITSINYTELDNGRLRYVVNQDTIVNEFQPLHELNGLSLNDVFDTNNLLTDPYFNSNLNDWVAASDQGFATQLNLVNNEMEVRINAAHTTSKFRTNFNVTTNSYYYYNFDVYGDANSNYIANYNGSYYAIMDYLDTGWNDVSFKTQNTSSIAHYFIVVATVNRTWSARLDNLYILDLTALGLENISKDKLDAYQEIYEYFLDGGTDPQTFTYDSPIYYDITHRLDEQFNELDITEQQFIDFQDGYNRIINNEQANDFIIYYAVQHAQDNNPTLTFTTEQWEQYYSNYLLFEDANTPFLEELNYYSLKQVFEESNVIGFGKNLISHYYNEFTFNGITFSYNSDGSFTMSGTCTASFTYRISADFLMKPNTVYTFQRFLISGNDIPGTNSGLEFNDGSVSLINQTASGARIFNSASRTSGYVRTTILTGVVMNHTVKYQLAEESIASNFELFKSTERNDNTPFINWFNLDELSINKTEQEMDEYYNDFQNNKTLEQNLYLSALETGSFSLIQPYYDYTAPPPDDFLDVSPDDFLGNILTDIGFNNDLGKSVLAIVILFFTAFTLFKYNMPNSVIIGVTVLTYVGLTFLGWLPAWINIVIAMIFILLMYLRFKGSGGSGNEENI